MDFYLTALLQGLCLSSMALGIYLSMTIFKIPDISTDGTYTLGGAVSGLLLSMQWSPALVFPLVFLAGAFAGACTGLIHTRLKINALLSGILVMTGLYSVNLTVMGRSNIPLLQAETLFDQLKVLAHPNLNSLVILFLFTLIAVLAIGFLLKSDYGLAMRATGNSENMVRALGVNTDRVKVVGLAFANALTASSGYLMTQFQGFSDINMGIGIVIVGLGSVIIAETFIQWMKIRSVWAILMLVCLGAILFQFVLAFTLSVGIDPSLLKLTTACFVLLVVSLPRFNFFKKSL